jgi:hypothetical protein
MTGMMNGEEKVTLRYVHKICDDIVCDPCVCDKVHIEGLPGNIDMELKGMMPLDESYVTSAAPTINVIPAVVEAAPGYRQAMDLPVVVPIK